MTNAIHRGKPDAGNPHVRFDEGEVASAKPMRGSLLYSNVRSLSAFVMCAGCLAGNALAVTPEFPDPVDGVVTISSAATYIVTEADDLSALKTINLNNKGATIVFDISADQTLQVAPQIKGSGVVVKRGEGTVCLNNKTTEANGYTVNAYLLGVITVEAGTLKFPQDYAGHRRQMLNTLDIWEGATVYAPIGGASQINLQSADLKGSGTLTAASGANSFVRSNGSFDGTITGGVTMAQPNGGTLTLSGTANDFTTADGVVTVDNGTLGLAKFGNSAGTAVSSMGKNKQITIKPAAGVSSGIAYAGTSCATSSVKLVLSANAGASATDKIVISGGAQGGITMSGDWVQSDYKNAAFWMQLAGEGSLTNVYSGKMTADQPAVPHIQKVGAGTWWWKPTIGQSTTASYWPRRTGAISVKEGTLMFNSLKEKGLSCSLGRQEGAWYVPYTGTADETKKAPFAFLLGGGDAAKPAVFESRGDVATVANAAPDRPVGLFGDATLKATGSQAFALAGVTSAADNPVTLTLDGDSADGRLNTVTNGASAISLVKKGSGTWTLSGEIDVAGTVDVQEGTLAVTGSDTPFSWFRLTIKDTQSHVMGGTDSSGARLFEFGLFAANGARQNKNLTTETTMNIAGLQPGQATADFRSISNGASLLTDAFAYIFDANVDTEFKNASFAFGENPKDWLNIYMRLRSGAAPVAGFDLSSYYSGNNYGRIWALAVAGSTDGFVYTELKDLGTNILKTAKSNGPTQWYSSGRGINSNPNPVIVNEDYQVASSLSDFYGNKAPRQFQNVTGVKVASGATLKATGTVTLPTKVSVTVKDGVASAGTIDGFAIPANGTLDLVGGKVSGELPLAFENVTGLDNFAQWSVTVGDKASSKSIKVRDGKLFLESPGLMMILR